MAQSGKVMLLYVNTGTSGSPIWTAIGQQQGFDISRGRTSTTVGHKDSSQEVTILGNKTLSLSLTGLYIRNDSGLARLRTAYDSGEDILVRSQEQGADIEEFLVKIQDFNEGHPHDGPSSYSLTLVPVDDVTAL